MQKVWERRLYCCFQVQEDKPWCDPKDEISKALESKDLKWRPLWGLIMVGFVVIVQEEHLRHSRAWLKFGNLSFVMKRQKCEAVWEHEWCFCLAKEGTVATWRWEHHAVGLFWGFRHWEPCSGSRTDEDYVDIFTIMVPVNLQVSIGCSSQWLMWSFIYVHLHLRHLHLSFMLVWELLKIKVLGST